MAKFRCIWVIQKITLQVCNKEQKGNRYHLWVDLPFTSCRHPQIFSQCKVIQQIKKKEKISMLIAYNCYEK